MKTLGKKTVFKSTDKVIELMLESKKQSKIESQGRYDTEEFQEVLRKLRQLKKEKK
jgi:hypothetical protein|nr:hypothetical protein [uncultured Flavobacterium sp.]